MTIAAQIPTENLPLWMRQARRGLDWGVLLVMVFGLLVTWSFLLQPGIPDTTANLNHAFMAADTADALREGRLYPRWSPHVLAGYGAPVANFYPPAAAYSVALVEVLFTNDTQTALRIVYAVALWAAGVGMYCFVTRWLGASFGVLASLLYLLSPYVGLVAPLVLGDLPGVISLALMPTLLWAVSRLLVLNRPADLALSTVVSAALILTEPRAALMGLLLTLLLAGWYFLVAIRKRAAQWGILWLLLVWILGWAITAFYWLPAVLEQDYVAWYLSDVSPPRYLLEWYDLIAPLRQIDSAELVPTPQFTLGWLLLAFVAAGVLGGLLYRRKSSLPLLFLGIGGVITALLLAVFPDQTWLMGTITLCAAVGGSASLALIERAAQRLPRPDLQTLILRLGLPALCTVVLLGSIPVWLAVRWTDIPNDLSPLGQVRYWLDGYGVPILAPGSPMPITIPANTEVSRFLVSGYQANSIRRLAPELVPGDMTVGVPEQTTLDLGFPVQPEEQFGHSGRFPILSERQTNLPLLLAWFPGWQATMNGQPIPLVRDPATGFVRIQIPVVKNWGELTVFLGETTVRRVAWATSWLMLIVLILITRLRFRRQGRIAFYDEFALLTIPQARLLTVVLICFAAILAMTVRPGAPLHLRAGAYYALEGASDLRAQTEAGLEVLGYRLEDTRHYAGERLRFTVYWRVPRAPGQNYRVVAHLYDINRRTRWAFTVPRHPGGLPTRRWRADGYITDTYHITLPDNMIPGSYRVALEVYACGDENVALCETRNFQRFVRFSDDAPPQQSLLLPDVITILDR